MPTKFVAHKWLCDNCPLIYEDECECYAHEREVHKQPSNDEQNDLRALEQIYNRMISAKMKPNLEHLMKYEHFSTIIHQRAVQMKSCAQGSQLLIEPVEEVAMAEMLAHDDVESLVQFPFAKQEQKEQITIENGSELANLLPSSEIHVKKEAENESSETIPSKHPKTNRSPRTKGNAVKVEGWHVCDECTKPFSSRSNLLYHKKYVHDAANVRKHVCPTCNKRFGKPSHLAYHQVCHTKERPFKCDQCDKAYTQRVTLREHYRIHVMDNVKVFPCNECGKSYRKNDELKRHILHVHENVRKHKCDVCDKRFHFAQDVRRHLRLHTNERPFKCDMCEKAFTMKNNLILHIRTHTGERPFKCGKCSQVFSQRYDCKHHEKKCAIGTPALEV